MKYCPLILLFSMIKSEDGIKHIDNHEILHSWLFLKNIYQEGHYFTGHFFWLTLKASVCLRFSCSPLSVYQPFLFVGKQDVQDLQAT